MHVVSSTLQAWKYLSLKTNNIRTTPINLQMCDLQTDFKNDN